MSARSLFDTIPVYAGVPFLLDGDLDRLQHGVRALRFAAAVIAAHPEPESTLRTHAVLDCRCLGEPGLRPCSAPILPETLALIESMFHYCRSLDPLEELAARRLSTEAIVPTPYSGLLEGLRRASYTDAQLYFCVLHLSEDEAHTLVMREIINRLLQDRPHRRAKVLALGEDVVRLRMGLLDSVLAGCPVANG